MPATPAVQLVIGAALLLLGRRLFWLFVAGIGFIVAINFTTQLLPNQPDWLVLLIALGVGVIGALLAIFLQRLAIGIAGFFAGGYLTLTLLGMLAVDPNVSPWILYVVGGIVGAIILGLLFDWALIFLSSLVGAALITETVTLAPPIDVFAFLGLLVLGIAVQVGLMQGRPAREAETMDGSREAT